MFHVVVLQLGKAGQGECGAKGELEGDIVLNCRAQIYARDIALHALVGDEMNALRFGCLVLK